MKLASVICALLGMIILLLPFGYQMIGLLFIFAAALCLLSHYRKLVISLLILFFSALLIIEIPILQGSRTDAPDDVDYLILLGAGVNGTSPSLSLLDRLEAAASYLKSHPDCKVVVTGGQGPGEDISEAQAMENYLLQQHISAARILKEDQAENTEQNIAFSYAIIQKETAAPSVAIVSSEYHLYRAKWIARKLVYDPTGLAAPTSSFLLKINYFLREALAVLKVWLF